MMEEYEAGKSLIKQKYLAYAGYLLFALFLTMVGVFVGEFVYVGYLAITIAFFVALIAFLATKGLVKKICFYLFCLIEGIMLAPTLDYYIGVNGSGIIAQTLIATIVVTVIALAIGYLLKDISFLKVGLFSCLIGFIVLLIMSFFIPLTFVAKIGAILYTIYIAYDINSYKLMLNRANGDVPDDIVITQVMNQYINIINLFLNLLRIFGRD